MKRILPLIVAAAALAFMLCSCDKHAFSETWVNHFSITQGESTQLCSDKTPTNLSIGEAVTIFATDEHNNRMSGGKYSVENNSEGVVGASAGDAGITVTGVKLGSGSIYVHWLWRGFDMHMSIPFSVSENTGE